MLPVLIIIGLPYLAGALTVVTILILRRDSAPRQVTPPATSQRPAGAASAPLRRDPFPLRTWTVWADTFRSDRDIVDLDAPQIPRPRPDPPYIPTTWRPQPVRSTPRS